MNERSINRRLRREIGKYSWALLIYYLILNVAVTVVLELDVVYHGFQAVIRGNDWSLFPAAMDQAMDNAVSGNGWGYLLACAAAVGLIPIWKGKRFFCSMFETKRVMEPGSFLSLVCLFFSGQMVFSLMAMIAEFLLNFFDLSVMESMQMASAGADTLSMFLYMGLGAPIVEEIVFRGLIMRGLEPYGKRFAIFASALLFGVFHGNLVQSPYAFLVGLILGYTAMEFSISWAMVLHMLNNLVLGDSLTRVASFMPQPWGDVLFFGIIAVSCIAGAVILIRKRRVIRAYNRADRMDRRCIRAFLTAVPNWLLFIIMTVSAVSMLYL